ncbi:MAG: helix-turn-helix transcriptional regulator [Phycisphaeraceae bacterium]|nr:helix-turn-helix transcriptional regulator [Phycisphaeraceae bacterium]
MGFMWRGGKVRLGVEYYNYPSLPAQRFWTNVLSMGVSTTPRDFVSRHVNRDGYLLHYLRRGEMWHRIDGREVILRAGAICLMDLQRLTEYGNSQRGPAENWWLLCNGREMPAMFAELRADQDPIFAPIHRAEFQRHFSALAQIIRRPKPGYEPRAAAALLTVLGHCFTVRARAGWLVSLTGKTGLVSPIVRRGIDYMTRNYHEPKTLKDITGVAGRSLFSFVRLFHAEVGVPPMQYLSRYRVEQAKRLLVGSDKSVTEIARLVGIPRANYFTRLFTRWAGESPRAYRTRMRRQKT